MTDYVNKQQALQFQKQCSYMFKDKQLHLIDKPARSRDRQCTDTCCLAVFLILSLGFLAYAIYSINFMWSRGLTQLNSNDTVTFLKGVSQEQFQYVGKVVGGCVGGSLIISLIVLILLKLFPHVMVVFMSFTTILIILAVALLDVITIQSRLSIQFFILAVIYGGFLFANWDNMKKAAIIMKTVGNFILDNPKILLITVFALLYCCIVLFLWIAGFYSFCTLYSHYQLSFGGFVTSFVFWVFMLVFWNYYFYYTSVFLTSTSLAIWFYDKTDKYDTIVTPFKLMTRYHLGTITFASLVITFGKIIKFLLIFARCRDAKNDIMAIIGCLISCIICCCLGALQAMIEVINNYAVIMCGLTGYSLIDSAKIVGQFIFNDPNSVFTDFTITNYIVNFGGIFTITIIPTLVGSIMLYQVAGALWALSVMMIFFTSSMIGLIVLQLFVESSSTLFLLYIMDSRLSQEGLDVVWVDKFAQELQSGFNQAFVGKLYQKKIKTRKITTYVVHNNGAVQKYKQQVSMEQLNRQGYNNSQMNIDPNSKQNVPSKEYMAEAY